MSQRDEERAAKKENPQPHGDAELSAMTVIIDGQAMPLNQVAEYNAQKKAQQEQDSAELHATTFIVDGMPMTLEEMSAYRAKQAAAEAQEEDEEDPEPDLTNPMAKMLYYERKLTTGKMSREEFDKIYPSPGSSSHKEEADER